MPSRRASARASSRSSKRISTATSSPRRRTLTSWPRPTRAGRRRRAAPPAPRDRAALRLGRALWLAGQLSPVLGLADRPAAPRRVAGEAAADVVAASPRRALPWPSLSSPRLEQLERLVGQVEQADQVRDRRAAAADAARQLLFGEPEVLDQRGAGARLVDRVEVLADHVLDQRHLQALGLARSRGRPPAPSRGRPAGPRASGARRRPARSCRRGGGGRAAAGRRRWPRSRRRARRALRRRSWVRGWSGSA